MVLVSFPDSSWAQEVGPVDGVDPVLWNPSDGQPPGPVELMVAPYLFDAAPLAVVAEVPSVRLVQLLTAGYDSALATLPPDVAVANAGGVHDASTAELAVGLVLASLRGIPEAVRAAADGHWGDGRTRASLADRRVLVVGYGSVGRAVATRLAAFEVRLTAVASRARAGDDLVERVHGVNELPALLRDAEVVVVVVPLTDGTRGLVGEEFLAALPDDALVVNIARGPVADTAALLRHAGRLAVALDVTDPEPLPDGHPLLTAPRTLITPHVGGNTTAFRPRALRFLREQLARVAAGEEPAAVVRAGTR
ncbi:MAG TPA: 2-hydroxyacid dehydrogenase [Dermatophilaceae bacterium]|nr:2-hydroxyacid dehydrogenase [Dermatophilaceae bacterium]